MTRFEELEREYSRLLTAKSEGASVLRYRRKRYNFKILAESAFAIHSLHAHDYNSTYKKALMECALLAEVYKNDGYKTSAENLMKELDYGKLVKATIEESFKKVVKILKLIWEHVTEFIMAFFDLAVATKKASRYIKDIIAKTDIKSEEFKGFIRTEFTTEVKPINNIDPRYYSIILREVNNVAIGVTKSFEEFGRIDDGWFNILRGKEKFRFRTFAAKNAESKKKLEDLLIYNPLHTKDIIKMTGGELWSHLKYIDKSITDLIITPEGNKQSIIVTLKDLKGYTDKKVLNGLISKITEQFDAESGYVGNPKELVDELTTAIRDANALLVFIHGKSKIFVGQMLKNASVICNLAKKYAPVKKESSKMKIEHNIRFGKKKDEED